MKHTQSLSDAEIAAALESCADEEIRIPGSVQPFACMIACSDDVESSILYASENCTDILGISHLELLGRSLRDVFGRTVVHDLHNAQMQAGFDQTSLPMQRHDFEGQEFEFSAFATGNYRVLEIEPVNDEAGLKQDTLKTLSFLIQQIQSCDTEKMLFDLTTKVMRHLTSFDRVMLYKFDSDYNGEIVAESKRSGMDSLLNLRFPHWDIPRKARDVMKQLSLRVISDVDQVPVPLVAARRDLGPLDIAPGISRGVSAIHMQYLRNMGIRATMTLSIVLDGKLWGMISFHNQRPKVASTSERSILRNFLPVFCGKLLSLTQKRSLETIRKFEDRKTSLLSQIFENREFDDAIQEMASIVFDVTKSTGFAFMADGDWTTVGDVPSKQMLESLAADAATSPENPLCVNSLAQSYPDEDSANEDCAGVMVAYQSPKKAIVIARPPVIKKINWAGNPDKKIEKFKGQLRLQPRGSFSAYLETVEGQSKEWSDFDRFFASQIWVLTDALERRSFENALKRQQSLLNRELNHRVRNILALVRSVSQQVRQRHTSLDYYAKSLEDRVQALAIAHDLSAGLTLRSVSLTQLIEQELEPYKTEKSPRVQLEGPEVFVRSDIAPILALVFHELTTNAAKYGALSVPEGHVEVRLVKNQNHMEITWTETQGPEVTAPQLKGFGSELIEGAVPYELGGTAVLDFSKSGLCAKISLPEKLFEDKDPALEHQQSDVQRDVGTSIDLQAALIDGDAVVLDDNFVIAQGLASQLEELGFLNVETFGNSDDLAQHLTHSAPSFAVLDFNLGAGGTSEAIAQRIHDSGIPIVFATGYGDDINIGAELSQIPVLTKPVSLSALRSVVAKISSDLRADV